MLRRSRFIPALAVAACGLLAASCSAATPAPSSQARTLSAGPALVYTAVAFPRAASGWLLSQPASGAARAEIWHSVTAGRTWQPQWQGPGDPLALSATDPAHAWALIACPGPGLESQGSSCTRTLIGTSDAGLHWRVIARLPAAVNDVRFFSGGLGVATSDRCLAAPSTTRCPGQLLVSLESPETSGPAGRTVLVLNRTTDNGRGWRQARTTLVAPAGAGRAAARLQ